MTINQHDEQGRRTGRWEETYRDGTLSCAGDYRAGLRVGEWRNYLRSGGLRSVGSYQDGKMHGR